MIISKTVSERLKLVIGRKVIGKEQTTFIQGRYFMDGPLIISKVISWAQRAKKKMMLFKVDFDNAFDLLNWNYFDDVEILGLWTRGDLLINASQSSSHPRLADHANLLAAGVEVEQEKISAVQSWPIPSTVKEVRGFLGLTGYYRRFVRNYGLLARPLTALTKKDGFVWSEKALQAFNHLKRALLSAPVLHLPDFAKQFVVECDASSSGVGAILSQEDHPIAYFSKGFSPSNRIKSAYDRELLALVLAVQKWNHYLLGRHFLVRTDHYTLKFLLEQRITTTEQQRLLLKLMPYDFSITHRAGKENRGADALSRKPHSGAFFAISIPYSVDLAEIKAGLHQDPHTATVLRQLQSDPSSVPDVVFRDQLLFFKGRLFIPDISSLKLKLLQEGHTSPTGGHGGFLKTFKRVSTQFYWPKMKQEIRIFVQNCVVCQQQKYQTLSPAGLLQPLPIPVQIWEDISMDFVVGLPTSHKFDTILVVVDRLSKYAHFLPLSHPFTAKTVAALFCKEIVRLHGFPRSIVSDRDAYLRCFAHEQPTKWSSYLSWAEFSYNTGYHTSTGTTPFSIVYGRDPPPLLPYVMGETKNADLEQQLIAHDDMLKLLRLNLTKAQDRICQQANSKRRDLTFQVGDYVFLKIQPYRQKSLAKRRYEKLSPRFFGPYRIKRTVGLVAYELELPADARIHPVFHVSMLKPARGSFSPDSIPPLPITNDLELDVVPASILDHRWVVEAGGSNDRTLKVYTRRKKKQVNITEGEQFIYLFGYQIDPLGQPSTRSEDRGTVQILEVRSS
ncbi:hypothetical protein LXL04_017328 [Taraxacum kok-saghyz]